jgi:hypothetical protein
MLEHDSGDVLRAGPLPWAAALRTAQDDVQGKRRQVLFAFLLAVAIEQPVPGCELLFERAFELVHDDLATSVLPAEAWEVLARHLPGVGWWDEWDACLRLRMGVVRAYVSGGLSPDSFRRLASDKWLSDALVRQAEATRRGRRFLRHSDG